MIITTDAIVLKTMRYRDTSRIATLYTRASGKMTVLAKGERERAAKSGGTLDILSVINAVIYKKEHRDLQLLSRSDLKSHFRNLTADMERMAAAMVVVELIDGVTHQEEENARLFTLLADTLYAIDGGARNVASVVCCFESHLLDILGFRPNWGTCTRCGKPLTPETLHEGMLLDPPAGGMRCADCTGFGPGTTSPAAVRVLQALQTLSFPHDALNLAMNGGVHHEVSAVLRRLLHVHVDGLRPSKAEPVFASLIVDGAGSGK